MALNPGEVFSGGTVRDSSGRIVVAVDPSSSVTTKVVPSGDTTGVADTANIQAAVNAVAANVYPSQGGRVVLGNGQYVVNAPITITADNVVIEGEGFGNPQGDRNTNVSGSPQQGGTILYPTSTFSGSYILKFGQSGTPSRTLSGCQLRNVSIDGSRLPASVTGVFWQVFKGAAEHVYVSKVTGSSYILDGNGSATFPDGAWDNHFYDVTSDNAGSHGFVLQNSATDNTFVECTSKYSGNGSGGTAPGTGDGFHVDASSTSNRWTGGYVYSNTGAAFNSANMFQLKWVGVRAQDCNGGIYLGSTGGTAGFVITGCTFRNMSVAADNTTDSINVTASSTTRGGLITGNDFYTNAGNTNGGTGSTHFRARYHINIAAGNVTNVSVGPNEASFDASAAAASFGTAFTNDGGTNTQYVGLGPSGLPEIKHSGGVRVLWRAGTPEGATAASVGSLCLRTDGGTSTTLYVKESGTGNTGWIAK